MSHEAFNTISPQAKDLVTRMLCREVPWRVSADEALAHEYLETARAQRPAGVGGATVVEAEDGPRQLVRGNSYKRLVEFNAARQGEAKRRWGRLRMALHTASAFSHVESQVVHTPSHHNLIFTRVSESRGCVWVRLQVAEERRAARAARQAVAEAEQDEARDSAEAEDVRREMAALQMRPIPI